MKKHDVAHVSYDFKRLNPSGFEDNVISAPFKSAKDRHVQHILNSVKECFLRQFTSFRKAGAPFEDWQNFPRELIELKM